MVAVLSLLALMGASQIGTNFSSEADINKEFQNIYLNMQPKFWRIQSSTPVPSDIANKEMVLFQSTNPLIVPRIYTKLNGQTWFVNLSSQ